MSSHGQTITHISFLRNHTTATEVIRNFNLLLVVHCSCRLYLSVVLLVVGVVYAEYGDTSDPIITISPAPQGLKPRKNVDVMREALEAVTTELAGLAKGACSASKKRKRDADAPAEAADTPAGSADAETPAGEPEKKKKKKEKKEEPAAPAEEEPAKKKKKKNKA